MAKKYDNVAGVWRTIRGRRVFIREGQSVKEAIEESKKQEKRPVAEKVAKQRKEKTSNKTFTEKQAEKERIAIDPEEFRDFDDEYRYYAGENEGGRRRSSSEVEDAYREMKKNGYVMVNGYQINDKAEPTEKSIQEKYGLKDKRNEFAVHEYEEGKIKQPELKDLLRRGGESEETIHGVVEANTGANSRDPKIRALFAEDKTRPDSEEYKAMMKYVGNGEDRDFKDYKQLDDGTIIARDGRGTYSVIEKGKFVVDGQLIPGDGKYMQTNSSMKEDLLDLKEEDFTPTKKGMKLDADKKVFRGGAEKGQLDSGTFFSPYETDAAEYGEVKPYMISKNANLYKGLNSQNYALENNLMNVKSDVLKEKLGVDTLREVEDIYFYQKSPSYLDKNPNLRFYAYQHMAKEDLKSKGYDGAYWEYEEDLTPKQYQIWNEGIFKPEEVKIKTDEYETYKRVRLHGIEKENMSYEDFNNLDKKYIERFGKEPVRAVQYRDGYAVIQNGGIHKTFKTPEAAQKYADKLKTNAEAERPVAAKLSKQAATRRYNRMPEERQKAVDDLMSRGGISRAEAISAADEFIKLVGETPGKSKEQMLEELMKRGYSRTTAEKMLRQRKRK